MKGGDVIVIKLDINSCDGDIAHVLEAAIWNGIYEQAYDELVKYYGPVRLQKIEHDYSCALNLIRECV